MFQPHMVLAQDGSAQAAQTALERAEAALAQARAAVVVAEQAVAAARQVARLPPAQGSLPVPPGPIVSQAIVPAVVTSPSPAATASPASHGERVPATLCNDPARILGSINDFTQGCLGMTAWSDFGANLNTAITGSGNSGLVSISVPVVRRWRGATNDYFRVQPGVRAQIGDGESSATFGDLTDFTLSDGAGLTLALEWGRSSAAGDEASVRSGLEEALRLCVAHHSAAIGGGTPVTESQSDLAVAPCSGENFRHWLSGSKRRSDYYKSIVRSLWGYDRIPDHYVGFDGALGQNRYEYYPLSDPAFTGVPLITSLPADFPNGQEKQKETVYSARLYTGLGFGNNNSDSLRGTIGLSLAYRRDFAWASGTHDQSICANPATAATPPMFIRCYERNIAAPYAMEGPVAGLNIRMQAPQLGFVRSLATELDVTYSFEEDQFGFRLPFYFVTDKEGAPNGGVVLSCRTAGETRSGFALDRSCTAGLFVSSEFSITR